MYTSIQLEVNATLPEHFKDNVLQLVDNMYYNTDRINYTFGADFMYTNRKSLYGSEMNGRFYFTGLIISEHMTPYRYAREIALVDDPTVKMNTLNSAIYGQLQTKLFTDSRSWPVSVRIIPAISTTLNFNQTVYDELGLRTDNVIPPSSCNPALNSRGT